MVALTSFAIPNKLILKLYFMMPQDIHIKPPIVRFFCGARASFGIHLLPIFYSGSIDLMMQNLFIVIFSQIAQSGRMMTALRKLKMSIVLVSVIVLRYGKVIIMNLCYSIHSNDSLHSFLQISSLKVIRFSQGNSSLNPLPIPIHSPPDSM